MDETPIQRALREKLRDPEVLQRIREITDEAEASGMVSTAKADRMRAQVAALEKEIEEAS